MTHATPEQMSAFLRQVHEIVDEHGVAIQYVMPEPDSSGFAYTVGCSELNKPEVVVCGLSPESAHSILNTLYSAMKEGALEPKAGMVLPGIVEDFDVTFTEVTEEHQANVARRFYGDNCEVLQLVMPDMNARWPWEEGYDLDPRVQKTWWVKPD